MAEFDLLTELQAKQRGAQNAPSLQPVAGPQPVAPAIPLDQAQTIARPRRRSQSDLYTAFMIKGALLIALAIVAGVWYVGAYFTLGALASWGAPVAAWGLAAWLIPVAISVIETGTMMARARIPAIWLIWLGVLGVDVFTTGAGILDQFAGLVVSGVTLQPGDLSSWVLVGLVGLGFALGPEPLARQIMKELLR